MLVLEIRFNAMVSFLYCAAIATKENILKGEKLVLVCQAIASKWGNGRIDQARWIDCGAGGGTKDRLEVVLYRQAS